MTSTHSMQRTSTRANDVESHDSAEGVILYLPRDDSVHHLNAMATVLYELSDGRSLASIARSVADIFEIDDAAASDLVASGFDELHDLGLVV